MLSPQKPRPAPQQPTHHALCARHPAQHRRQLVAVAARGVVRAVMPGPHDGLPSGQELGLGLGPAVQHPLLGGGVGWGRCRGGACVLTLSSPPLAGRQLQDSGTLSAQDGCGSRKATRSVRGSADLRLPVDAVQPVVDVVQQHAAVRKQRGANLQARTKGHGRGSAWLRARRRVARARRWSRQSRKWHAAACLSASPT